MRSLHISYLCIDHHEKMTNFLEFDECHEPGIGWRYYRLLVYSIGKPCDSSN